MDRLLELWRTYLAGVLQSLGGTPLEVTAAEPAAPGSDLLSYRIVFTGASGHECVAMCAAEEAEALGRVILAGAGAESAGAAEPRQAFSEVLGRTAALASRLLGETLQAEAGFTIEQTGSTGLPDACAGVLKVSSRGEKLSAIHLAFSPALAAILREAAGELRGAENPAGPALLHQQVPVRVLLGSARLTLRDVLSLSTGSVIELQRLVTDPASVYVAGCRIAEGRVVVVRGNYGVELERICEPPTVPERLPW